VLVTPAKINFVGIPRRFVWLTLNPISTIRHMHLCSDSLDFDDVHDLSDWVGAFDAMPTVEKRGCARCDFEQLRFHDIDLVRQPNRLAESA
jgi:hypothetical protein